MKVICPNCSKEVGEVTAVARLILTVHCPFDGSDFGVAVDPPVSADDASASGYAAKVTAFHASENQK